MENEKNISEVKLSQFEKILAILKNEYTSISYSRLERISFNVLNICVLWLILSLMIFDNFLGLFSELKNNINFNFWNAIITGFFLFFLIISFILSIRYLVKSNYRNRFKYSRLKKTIRNRYLKESRGDLLVIGIQSIVFLCGLYLSIRLFFRTIRGDQENGIIVTVVSLIAAIIIIISIFSIHYALDRKIMSKAIDKLQKAMSNYRNQAKARDDGSIQIPQDDYELLAMIERAQIISQQEKSIAERHDLNKLSEYSILTSSSYKKSIKELDLNERLAVEDHIDHLLQLKNQTKPNQGEDDGVIENEISSSNLILKYMVDVDNKLIKIIDTEMD